MTDCHRSTVSDFISGWKQVYNLSLEIPGSILGADLDVRGGENSFRFADQLAAFAERTWTGKSEQNVTDPLGKGSNDFLVLSDYDDALERYLFRRGNDDLLPSP